MYNWREGRWRFRRSLVCRHSQVETREDRNMYLLKLFVENRDMPRLAGIASIIGASSTNFPRTQTIAGTRILLEAGLQPLFMPPEKDKISSAVRGAICVDPVPRNIHPVHNEGRRKARAEAILGKIDSSSTALFVDADKHWKKDEYVVTVVNAKRSLVNAATVVTGFTHEAEELAIACRRWEE
ncbi:hypothetical protein HPB52_000438 [Rhipicephalus sanguineus]|uniref:Uncharacterized protein n=1 Tax=Rhipicephalus sanguineus TaxID=34632 RepID=A0A9D4PED3_RHISA|nr:hypothetical protein HPB52_000438 [Rhipicephalus sanguineus]